MNSSESNLVERLQQGDSSAFKELVETHKNRVYNTCLGFLHNPEDAEDISQEVFIQVYESIPSFRMDASISTWLYRIAVTKSLELIRYRNREKRKGFFSALLSPNPDPDQIEDSSGFVHPGVKMEQKQRAEILQREISRLPENQQVAFTLHKIEDLSYAEIAEVMERSLPAVESLMHRAKKNLRKQLYNYYQENEIE